MANELKRNNYGVPVGIQLDVDDSNRMAALRRIVVGKDDTKEQKAAKAKQIKAAVEHFEEKYPDPVEETEEGKKEDPPKE